MDTYTACSIIESFDGQEHSHEEIVAAVQSLIDSGVVWRLQGFYGRLAVNLIGRGECFRYTDENRPGCILADA